MLLIIYAHPYPQRSQINNALLKSISDLDDVRIHSLYDIYPDFNIDVLIEQSAVNDADTVILQHPMQWYNMPSMLKLWIDRVFEYGWAYGHGGNALRGKNMLWVTTTGGAEDHFESGDYPGFDVLSQPLQKTALYCGMNWLPPFVLHNTFEYNSAILTEKITEYRQFLITRCGLRPKPARSDDPNERQ